MRTINNGYDVAESKWTIICNTLLKLKFQASTKSYEALIIFVNRWAMLANKNNSDLHFYTKQLAI